MIMATTDGQDEATRRGGAMALHRLALSSAHKGRGNEASPRPYGRQPPATSRQPLDALDFTLPPELEASEPPEARGLARDEVRLMVSYASDDRVMHAHFRDLPYFLEAGDVLVINTSGTLNAALNATRADGTPLELHLSTHLPDDVWTVEVRRPQGDSTVSFQEAIAGETLRLPGGAPVRLHGPYDRRPTTNDRRPNSFSGRPVRGQGRATGREGSGFVQAGRPVALPLQAAVGRRPSAVVSRLWLATLDLPWPLHDYLACYGFPIRYGYVRHRWPITYYQTVYANEPGSAEMPSAGRAFTPELITQLVARGVHIVPLVLHTGVASLEEHEPPYEEYYRVPQTTAETVNAARPAGRRVIAVGTTAARALETTADAQGKVRAGEGWTGLVITAERGLRVVNGLLTGLHEPFASHLAMLEALSGRSHLAVAYGEALREHYLWHEFGDLHLILP